MRLSRSHDSVDHYHAGRDRILACYERTWYWVYSWLGLVAIGVLLAAALWVASSLEINNDRVQ